MNKTKVESQTETALAVAPEQSLKLRKEAIALQQMVDVETQRRAILTDFINHHMKKGVDFGGIHINKSCPNKYDCKIEKHFSKDSLFKAGAEKFCSLMQLRAVYKRDLETWEMLGNPAGTVCLICELYDNKDKMVGEGRGCSSIAEKGNANTAIKIAEKRSKVDAVLSTGGLSDFFTQDIEDMDFGNDQPVKQPYRKPVPQKYSAANTSRPQPISENQKKVIFSVLNVKGKLKEDLDAFLIKAFNLDSVTKLSYENANKVIMKLKELPDPQPIDYGPEIDLDEVDEGIEKQRLQSDSPTGGV